MNTNKVYTNEKPVNTPNPESSSITTSNNYNDVIIKVFFIVGLYASFLFSGIYEEKLYKGNYFNLEDPPKKLKFGHPLLAIFINSLISYILSEIILFAIGRPKKSAITEKDKFMLGTFSMCSRVSSENALNYLDFISKIIGKSCKSISIIAIYFLYNIPFIREKIIKKLINQKDELKLHTHGMNDLLKVVVTTLSILLFNLEESSSSGNSMAVFKTFLLGYGLLLISLFFDGLMALKEKIVNHEVHHNPEFIENKHTLAWEYMSLFSIYSILFSLVGLGYELIYSDLYKWILIYLSNSHLLINLLLYSFTSSLGQIFLFQFLEKYGPLTLSIITGVRKILSIALSIVFFGKVVSVLKIVSLILGTTVIAWEVSDKTSKSSHSHGGTPHHVDKGETKSK